jgi:hypothetical protein
MRLVVIHHKGSSSLSLPKLQPVRVNLKIPEFHIYKLMKLRPQTNTVKRWC